MIIGIGTDIVDCTRLERPLRMYREKFLQKILTPLEIRHAEDKLAPINTFLGDDASYQHLSLIVGKFFAAKEAFVKALGTGFRDGVRMQDIEVHRDKHGKPFFKIKGHTKHVLDNLSPIGMHSEIHLSLSDEAPYATAYVIISAL
jgi:holo-[acyl-carrier protein] synthase